jgi:CRP-like cAMP-binding protein
MAGSDRMNVPLSQQHLADLLGLSLVHTNKSLKRLESDKLLSWNKGVVAFLDREALMDLAEFEEPTDMKKPFI